jgi:hypothetical protein
MDSASSLAYPGSRVVAGWWRQLQAYQPAGLWVGYLFVHRVEGVVECAEPRPVDALSLHLLRALAVDQRGLGAHEHDLDLLPGRLHLPPPALERLLAALADQGLVSRCEPGCWCLSTHGHGVLRDGADLTPRRERRSFPFVERLSAAGRRVAAPHFFPIHESPAQSWDVDDAHHFDLALLHETLSQTSEWKARHNFPAGVRRLLDSGDADPDKAWQGVIVDRPQRVPIALITTPPSGEPPSGEPPSGELLGFAAQAEGWKLVDRVPVVRLPESARAVLPELAAAPTAWEEAWRLWCRQRSLPLSEADACRLHFDGIHLDVQAPESFVLRLRATRSDLFQEECALLAGDGYLRATALLRLQT